MSIFRHGLWHRWFAWHPVYTFTHGWRWMRVVERRRWIADVPGAPDGWDYRPVSRTMSGPTMKHEEAVSLLHSRGLTDEEIAHVCAALTATVINQQERPEMHDHAPTGNARTLARLIQEAREDTGWKDDADLWADWLDRHGVRAPDQEEDDQ